MYFYLFKIFILIAQNFFLKILSQTPLLPPVQFSPSTNIQSHSTTCPGFIPFTFFLTFLFLVTTLSSSTPVVPWRNTLGLSRPLPLYKPVFQSSPSSSSVPLGKPPSSAKMKNMAAVRLKKVMGVLTTMARGKTSAFKSKTRSMHARLVILFLLTNRKFLMASFSQKLQSLLRRQPYQCEETAAVAEAEETEGAGEERSKVMALHEEAIAGENAEKGTDGNGCREDGEECPEFHDSVPDDSEAPEFEGSVMGMAKDSKREAGTGREFDLEEDIDHVAELFIRKFHTQMMLQKLH